MKGYVRVYIEGGAAGRGADALFRRGWRLFLKELDQLARDNGYQKLEVVRGLGRADAYKGFKRYSAKFPRDLPVLLVDSETPVPAGTQAWDFVARNTADRWERPSWATERHLYFMAHSVETWLLTDPDALAQFYKRDFNPSVLPSTNLEGRSKRDIFEALKKATQKSKSGPYEHSHAFHILETLRPDRVKTLFHGNRLFEDLAKLIEGKT